MSRAVFLSPHDDDHALFGAFTCIREKPTVVVVFDSYVQKERGLPITREQRLSETDRACEQLGCKLPIRLGFRDTDLSVSPMKIWLRLDEMAVGLSNRTIYAPADEPNGHPQHNMVSVAAGRDAIKYLTYTTAGKSTSPREVKIEDPRWIAMKLRALACYESQFLPAAGCVEHFIGRSLQEYYL